MTVSLQFLGVTTSSPHNDPFGISNPSRNNPFLSVAFGRLQFAESVVAPCRLYDGGCRTRVLDRSITVCCKKEVNKAVVEERGRGLGNVEELTCVMKFGGSSVGSAERMREVAGLVLGFPEENPVIVLSAMGKTTNHLLLAGEKALSCGNSDVTKIDELTFIKELHLRTVQELGVDTCVVSAHLEELEQLLKGIARIKELTLRTRDYLVSFGECMSTRIFAAYLNKIGAKARQILHSDWISDPAIPVVTGFLGKGCKSCVVTTLGRGGSDLTATTIGKALGLREIQHSPPCGTCTILDV